jgi:hypothetical protein
LKAKNVALKGAKPYDACPYCLTDISVPVISANAEAYLKREPKSSKIEKEMPFARDEKGDQASPRAQGCAHHLGYLSKRAAKEKIPEDCMTCENIIKCMLKAVTG